MARTNTARWEDRSDTESHDLEETGAPTRRLPTFVLSDEAKRVEHLLAVADANGKPDANLNDDATLNVSPEESRRLLANAFAERDRVSARPSTDDEPTLDTPAPSVPGDMPSPAPDPPRLVRAARHHDLVLTSLPPAPVSAVRRRVEQRPRPSDDRAQRWIVAGIWVTALGLFALLMVMVSST